MFADADPKLTIFKGDLRDKHFVEKVFSDIYKVNNTLDGVIHLAGLKSVLESQRNPLLYWNNNVLGALNLIEIMNSYECINFVFSSSATVYSQRENSLLNEELNWSTNPYGNTKLIVEKLLEDIFNSQKIRENLYL